MQQTEQAAGQVADELSKLLSGATSAPAAASGSNEVLFGMTLAGLVLASLFSLVGMAYLLYAKKQGRLIVGLSGIWLLVFPFFVTNTYAIAAIGTVLVLLPPALKRVGIDM